jgi:hypothetical protein
MWPAHLHGPLRRTRCRSDRPACRLAGTLTQGREVLPCPVRPGLGVERLEGVERTGEKLAGLLLPSCEGQALSEAQLRSRLFEWLPGPSGPLQCPLEGLLKAVIRRQHRATAFHRRRKHTATRFARSLLELRQRALSPCPIAPSNASVDQVLRPGHGSGPGAWTLRADRRRLVQPLNCGVDSSQPELQKADRLAGIGFNRAGPVTPAELDGLSRVPATGVRPAEACLHQSQLNQTGHGLIVEAGELGGAERLYGRHVGGRQVPQAVLEIRELGKRPRQGSGAVAGREHSRCGARVRIHTGHASNDRPRRLQRGCRRETAASLRESAAFQRRQARLRWYRT